MTSTKWQYILNYVSLDKSGIVREKNHWNDGPNNNPNNDLALA